MSADDCEAHDVDNCAEHGWASARPTVPQTRVVHGLPPMTLAELSVVPCGHCAHRLTMHITKDGGATYCAICHCLRGPSEDILKPHNFSPATRECRLCGESVEPARWHRTGPGQLHDSEGEPLEYVAVVEWHDDCHHSKEES